MDIRAFGAGGYARIAGCNCASGFGRFGLSCGCLFIAFGLCHILASAPLESHALDVGPGVVERSVVSGYMGLCRLWYGEIPRPGIVCAFMERQVV